MDLYLYTRWCSRHLWAEITVKKVLLAIGKTLGTMTEYNCCSFFFFNKFIYLWLHWVLICCVQAFFSCSKRGLIFVVVRGLLFAVASLVAEHGL